MSDKEKKDAAQAAAAAQASAPAPQPEASEPSKKKEKAEKKDKPAKKDKEKKPSAGERFSRWLREMKSELKKVSWPSFKDTMRNVGIVIICVLVVGIVIALFDTLVRAVVDALLNLF